MIQSFSGFLARLVLVAAVAGIALVTTMPAEAANHRPTDAMTVPLIIPGPGPVDRVSPALFGLHDDSQSAPHLDAIRLWDDGTRWDQVCPEQDACNWQALDESVDNARARGASEILYVLGSTPIWAASQTDADGYFGAGTAAMPRDLDLWRSWVRSVAERYQGRITAYEIWNEANLSAFFSGTPQDMARLTQIAAQEIRAVDPSAKIVTPSVVLRHGRTGWLVDYLAALRDTDTKVDAINLHGYVWRQEGPGNGSSDQRRQVIRAVREAAVSEGFDAPLWDTEVNFGNSRANGWPTHTYTDATSVTMLGRSFVDSQRLGVAREFWYAWDKQVMSVNLTDPSGSVTAVGHAYYRLRNWMAGAQWRGCRVRQAVLSCAMMRHGRLSLLVMTQHLDSPPMTLRLGPHARWVCHLDSSCGLARTARVGNDPQLIHLGRLPHRKPSGMARPVPPRTHRPCLSPVRSPAPSPGSRA